jgi:Tfp pilus assembly protein PilF
VAQGPGQVVGVVAGQLAVAGEPAAAEAARMALEADPASAANHNNHGIALLYAGRPDAARQAFLDALERDAALPGALYNLAIVEAFYFFDEDAARGWFDRYVATGSRDDPDDLSAHFGLELGQVLDERETR